MNRLFKAAVVASMWLAPAVAFADPPPADTVGSSPEPAAWLLLALGMIPAALLYARARRAQRVRVEA